MKPKRQNDLGKDPLGPLLLRLAVPAITAQLVNALYNIVDRMYIGHIQEVGDLALTGLGVAFPVLMFISALSALAGMGGGSRAAIRMGAGDEEGANAILGGCTALLVLVSIVVTVVFQLLREPMLYAFGASGNTIGYASGYLKIYLWGTIAVQLSLGLNNFITTQGFSTTSMLTVVIGAVCNIVLDPIFIFGLDLGVQGAALATILSQFLSFCLLVGGTFHGDNLPLSLRAFRPTVERYSKIISGGLPSFWRQALASVATILLNVAGREFGGGDVAVAAMSIVSRITMFAGSALVGFGQGYQPVCGFNYGAKLYGRVREAFFFFFKVAAVGALILAALGFLFSPQLVAIFRRDDSEVIRIGATALRMQCVTFPLMAWFFPTSMTLQTTGLSLKASALAMCRQGLFFLPFILTLPRLWGIPGIQLSQPAADLCSFLVALPMGLGVLRDLRLAQEGLEAQKE